MDIEPMGAHRHELQVWATRTSAPWGEGFAAWSSFAISLAIRAFTLGRYGGRYSHVGIRYGSFIYEATERGVCENLAETYNSPYRTVDAYHINCRDADESRILAWLIEQLGTPYDFGQLVKIALELGLAPPRLWGEWLDSDHRYICSELVALAYLRVGVDLRCGDPLWLVTPDHVRRYARRHPARVTLRGRVRWPDTLDAQ